MLGRIGSGLPHPVEHGIGKTIAARRVQPPADRLLTAGETGLSGLEDQLDSADRQRQAPHHDRQRVQGRFIRVGIVHSAAHIS